MWKNGVLRSYIKITLKVEKMMTFLYPEPLWKVHMVSLRTQERWVVETEITGIKGENTFYRFTL